MRFPMHVNSVEVFLFIHINLDSKQFVWQTKVQTSEAPVTLSVNIYCSFLFLSYSLYKPKQWF